MTYSPPGSLLALFGWAFPPPPVQIDFATSHDTPTLAAIHAEAFRHEWSMEELAALIGDPQVLCLVAKRANAFGSKKPIGFLLLRLAADEAEVLTIAVDARRKKRGYGRLLMLAGIDRLIRRGVNQLFLEVDGDNSAAVRLYARLGFIQVGERKGYYRTGDGATSNALVMRLDLG